MKILKNKQFNYIGLITAPNFYNTKSYFWC